MRNQLRSAILALLFLVSSSCGGCAGTAARDTTLLPTMRLAWVDIKAGAEREAAQREDPGTAAAKIADADRALTVSQVPETAIAAADWETVLELASGDVTRRVDREEIGPGVALSLNERIRLFRDSLDTYLRRK